MIYIKTEKLIGEFIEDSKLHNTQIRSVDNLDVLKQYKWDIDYEIINGDITTVNEIQSEFKNILGFSDGLKNCITFTCTGAIDFSEVVAIELSLEGKGGFTETHPLDLMIRLNDIKHIRGILHTYFSKIVGKIPHISDKNEDLPIEKRFTKVYYKCFRQYKHSHSPYDEPPRRDTMSLYDALKYISDRNLDIDIP